jgi:hypothetical protein
VTLETRARALMNLVEADRARQCEALLSEAKARAMAMLRQAHADARARVRQAFAEQRQRSEERIAAARARLQTRRRLNAQRRTSAVLAQARLRLPEELLRRWQSAEQRRIWIERAIASAGAVLPRGTWTIAHPPRWAVTEQHEFAAAIAGEFAAQATFVADATIRAGLRIGTDGNVIDATLEGLAADRQTIDWRLLHHWERNA